MRVAAKKIPYYGKQGYDAWVVDEENKLFGVFDGMGTSEGSRKLALRAAEMFNDGRPTFLDSMAYRMKEVLHEARGYGSAGTTATVVSASNYLHYVHIGDSRLYVLNDNRLKQMTADEGIGNILYNYVGPNTNGLCQLGQVQKWDRFFLCTDGVTGDWEDQFIPEDKLERIMVMAETPQDAVDQILEASNKKDDKTIIVVFKE